MYVCVCEEVGVGVEVRVSVSVGMRVGVGVAMGTTAAVAVGAERQYMLSWKRAQPAGVFTSSPYRCGGRCTIVSLSGA